MLCCAVLFCVECVYSVTLRLLRYGRMLDRRAVRGSQSPIKIIDLRSKLESSMKRHRNLATEHERSTVDFSRAF